MNLRRLFTLGVLALGSLSGAAAAQYYPNNPYNAYNPNAYNAHPPRPMPSPYPQAYYPQAGYPPNGYPAYPQAAPQAYGYNPYASPAPRMLPPAAPSTQPIYYSPPPNESASITRTLPAGPSDTPRGAAPGAATQGEAFLVVPDKADTRKNEDGDTQPGGPEILGQPKESPRRTVEIYEPAVGLIGEGYGAHGPRPWGPGCDRDGVDLKRCYFEAGGIFLQTRWHDNPAFITRSAPVGGASVSGFTDFSYDWAFALRGEIGFQNDSGFGVRGRYMYFSQLDAISGVRPDAATTLSSAAPLGINQIVGVGDIANARSVLTFHVADIEAQQEFRWGPYWSLRGSAGGRYAYLQQTYDFNETTAAATTNNLHSFFQFSGGGPTVALELRRYFCHCNLNVYGLARGSLLFGRFSHHVDNTSGGTLVATASRTEEDALPMGELEGGVEWGVDVHKVRVFVSGGFFGQVWWGAGNSSDSSPGFNGASFDPNAQSRRDLMLLGVAVTAGVQF